MRAVDYVSLSWRAMWERRGRTIGAIVGIVIAILALGLALGAGQGFRTMTTGFFERVFGINTIVLFPAQGSSLTLTDEVEVSNLPHVESVEPILETTAIVNVNGHTMHVNVVGVTENELLQMYGVTSLSSALLSGEPILQTGTALVGYFVAFTNTGQEVIYPGQTLVLDINGRLFTVTVTGILKSGAVGLIGINPNNAVFIDSATFLNEIDRSGTVNGLIINVDQPKYVDEVTSELESLYPQDEVLNLSTLMSSVNQYVTMLELFLALISGISFVIIGIWIFDTTTISVIQRIREFGIMRAVGFSRVSIFTLLILEAAMTGLIGSAMGVGALLAITRIIRTTSPLSNVGAARGFAFRPGFAAAASAAATASSSSSSFGISVPIPIVISAPYAALLFILPIVVVVVASILPAYRAMRTPPAQTLRYE